ncbi:unnamed protein product [Lota lota]
MSLSLVLLLLPGILSQEVCLNISNGEVEMKLANISVHDKRLDKNIQCMTSYMTCFINCTNFLNGHKLFDNQSSVCHNVIYQQNSSSFSISSYGTCRVHLCTSNETELVMKEVNRPTSGKEKMVEIHLLRLMCADIFAKYKYLQILFIKAELKIIHNILNMTPHIPGQCENVDLKYMSFDIFSIGIDNLTAGTSDLIEVSQVQTGVKKCNGTTSVWLPKEDLGKIDEDKRVVNVVNYESTQQFQLNEEVICSMVTRIEFLGEKHLSNLKTPVEMILQVQKDVSCTYINHSCYYKWKTDGCQTYRNASVVTCKCTHTTAFSVLLIQQPIGKIHWEILSYISYIGCGLSAFCSALSLMIYVIHSKQREEPSIFIHVSLSGALFLLNSSFLLTEWGATVSPGWVCGFIAALVHYSLLGTFTWLAVEGLHLYLMLIKVFNTEYRHYLLKLSLFGWGIPAVVVGVTLSMKDVKLIYGLTRLTMLDSNQTNNICWIMDTTYLYVTNVVYISLVFIFNSGILLIVTIRVCHMATTPARSGLGWRNASTVVGLTCLLGVTWGLAFLGSGYINYPILYLFCIFNSTEGVFILFWILCLARNEKKRTKEAQTVSFSTNDSKAMNLK